MEPEKPKQEKKKKKSSGLKLFFKILLGLFLFIFVLILFIRSPWGQNIIVDKLVSYISDKTNTEIAVDRVFITFGGDISIEGLYMEDEAGDTLVYTRSLEADIPFLPIIKGNGFSINSLDLQGGRANIKRKDTIQGFNFDFLMNAFATADSTATATPVDTTTSSMEIALGDINIEDFRFSYDDRYMGIDTRGSIGKLQVEMQEFGLDSMKFKAADALIENTNFKYAQTKPLPESDGEPVPMPNFSIENLKVNNVVGTYESVPDGILADFNIGDLLLELPKADIEGTALVVDMLELQNSTIYLQSKVSSENPATATEPTAPSEEGNAFTWPAWTVQANNIDIQNTDVRFWVNDNKPTPGTFNPNAIGLQDLNLNLPELILKNQALEASVEKLNFREASGINLKETQFAITVNEENISLQDLIVQINANRIEGNLAVNYDSLDAFMNQPEDAAIDLNIPWFNVDLSEIYRFQPDLRQNEYFAILAKKGISGNLSAKGTMEVVNINNANVKWGRNTSLSATGTVNNATNMEALSFNFPKVRLNATRGDLRNFVKPEDFGIQMPSDLALTGNVRGSLEDIAVDAVITSSEGKIDVNGRFVSEPGLAFNADIAVTELHIGNLLQNESLGPVTLELTASGSGADLNSLDATVDGTINSFVFNKYEFEDIGLTAQLEDGDGFANINYEDENLNMKLESFVQLDSIAPEIALNLNILGADLEALGLTPNPVKTAMEVKGNFKGNIDTFDASVVIEEGVFVSANESFLLGDVDILAHVTPDTTSLAVQNRMLDLRLDSNAGPMDFINALNRHYQSYYTSEKVVDTVANPVNINLRAQVSPSPILEEVFLPQLEAFDTLNVQVDFREREKTLIGEIRLPFVRFMGSEVDSLQISLDSNPEELFFDFGLKSLDAGPLAIKRTLMEGTLINEELQLHFTSNFDSDTLINFNTLISKNNDVLRIHIDPKDFVLDSSSWNVTEGNEILIGNDFYTFNNFRLSREDQELEITNDMAGVQKEHIAVEFQNFNLAALFSYLNPEYALASGNLNGDFLIEEPFGSTGWVADLTINELEVMEVPLGVLSFDANDAGADTYNFEVTVKEGNADIDIFGTYIAGTEVGDIDMDVNLNNIKMELVEGFSMGAVINPKGDFSGQFKITGDPFKPEYEGNLDFTQAQFTVAILNTPFILPNETLRIDNSGLYMEDFDIKDVNGNSLVLNGNILTESLLNPEFNISFTANNFKALNSTEEDFDLFYGVAVFDAAGSVSGTLELPQVELDLEVLPETNITYVIPETNLEIEEREGVVIFVNKENPDSILTRRTDEEESFGISGFELNSVLSLQEGATFTIILNEDTGDHFKASGEGDLLYDMFSNGRTTLSGRIEIIEGYYEMSLYNMVTRRFDIMEGSSVVWAGDIMDADLDVTAVYEVEASASGLMAAQTTGTDMDIRNQFRQELDFLVYLRIGGEISAPRISFGLDMPEDEQGSLSGQVYGRVQQVNQQENELNKQVFSLLVLNRFFPTSGSDGTGGGTLSFARDNLNEALSDQLNIFSDKLLGETGVDLNFGLNSFTDYQGASPQDRTQLDITAQKNFLDERLVVSVGSEVDVQGDNPTGESSPLIGNVSLEYLVTEDGRFRVQGFRKNSYENVIDGQLIISGLAFIYTQEFNRFRELWNQITGKDEEEPVVERRKIHYRRLIYADE